MVSPDAVGETPRRLEVGMKILNDLIASLQREEGQGIYIGAGTLVVILIIVLLILLL